MSTLCAVVATSDVATLQRLIDDGTNLSQYNNLPLHIAVVQKRNDMVHCLLKNGADLTAEGHDSFYTACMHGDLDIVKTFIKYGADPNAEVGACIRIALEYGHIEVVKFLVEKGGQLYNYFADIVCEQEQWETAFWLIEKKGLTPFNSFEGYEHYRKEKRQRAVNKIYFWILPKLYRNKEFVQKQAEKSYERYVEYFSCISFTYNM